MSLSLVNVCLWLIVSSYPCWIGCDGPPVIFGVSISVEVEVDFGILVGVKDLPDFDFSCISSRN